MLKFYYNTGPNPMKVALFLEDLGHVLRRRAEGNGRELLECACRHRRGQLLGEDARYLVLRDALDGLDGGEVPYPVELVP